MARIPFAAIVVEHPLLGLDAVQLTSWLRDAGAYCPMLVVATTISARELPGLVEGLEDRAKVVGAVGGAVRELRRIFSEPAATAPPSTAVSAPKPKPKPTPAPEPLPEPAVPVPDPLPAPEPEPVPEPVAAPVLEALDDAPASEAEASEAEGAEAEGADADGFELTPFGEEPSEATSIEEPPPAPPEEEEYEVAEVRVETLAEDAGVSEEAARRYLEEFGDAAIALPVEGELATRWVGLELPPQLIGLLDGDRTRARGGRGVEPLGGGDRRVDPQA